MDNSLVTILKDEILFMKKILVLTDNDILLSRFVDLIDTKKIKEKLNCEFYYFYSFNNKIFKTKYEKTNWFKPIKIKDSVDYLCKNYNIIFSLHCKQIFPEKLVNSVKCINVHPGLNPYNRGWFPQVFSIINGLPCGATIHEIDEKLDHGPVICQKKVDVEMHDTSFTLYNKIIDAEIFLLENNIENIIQKKYETIIMQEGNINLKKDFDDLCEINLEEIDTFKNHINKLRSLTHGDYSNAYFKDENGNKIYLKLHIEKSLS